MLGKGPVSWYGSRLGMCAIAIMTRLQALRVL
jgi:hypothetical protein